MTTAAKPLQTTYREAIEDALQCIIRFPEQLGVESPESDDGQLTTLDRIVRYLSERVT